jgi:hypothetical protein
VTDDSAPLAEVRPIRPKSPWWAQWPLAAVLATMGVSFVFVALDEFRLGSVLLGVSVLLAFVLRLVLPDGRIGLLAVRTKRTDLIVLGALGVALTIFALWVPPPS